MITDHMYDAGFEFLDNGNVNIEQSAGSLEGPAYITLHPVQVRLLAERMGILATPPIPADWIRDTHVRHVRALNERFKEFYYDEYYHDEIWKRCGEAPEIALHLRAIKELLDEVMCDLGGNPSTDATRSVDATPIAGKASNEKSSAPRNGNSTTGFIVTESETSKRGRPATGEALTNAERQKAFRDRKAGGSQPASLSLPLEAEI